MYHVEIIPYQKIKLTIKNGDAVRIVYVKKNDAADMANISSATTYRLGPISNDPKLIAVICRRMAAAAAPARRRLVGAVGNKSGTAFPTAISLNSAHRDKNMPHASRTTLWDVG